MINDSSLRSLRSTRAEYGHRLIADVHRQNVHVRDRLFALFEFFVLIAFTD